MTGHLMTAVANVLHFTSLSLALALLAMLGPALMILFAAPSPQPKPNPGGKPGQGNSGQPPAEGENPEDEEDEEEEGVAGEVNDVLREMLPWMTSLLFHLGLIVLALFLVWSYLQVTEEDVPIIPIARLSDNPGGQLTQSESLDLQATQQVRDVQAEDVSTSESMNNLSSNTENNLSLVGLSGGGGGGKMAPFGTTTGTSTGISAGFYGTGGNARKIIYIVDASGSLIDTLPFVIKELKRSISELSDKQEFSIIFFQAGEPREVPPRGWKTASSEMKKRCADYISLESGNIIPRGITDPIATLQLAMRYRPELVFLLSDNITGRGKYEVDRGALMAMLDKLNKDRKIKLNTIQFLHPDPLNTLRDLAKEHGGVYKFITEADLGLK